MREYLNGGKTVLILADDLTGAGEIGAALRRQGKPALVFASCRAFQERSKAREASTAVINMDSRRLPRQQAGQLFAGFSRQARSHGWRVVYYKIDSTVRGNFPVEFTGFLDACLAEVIVVVPALPELGRITVGGYHLVHGAPVGVTGYARRSRQSHLPSLLAREAKRAVAYIPLSAVAAGPGQIEESLRQEQGRGAQIIVVDCTQATHLADIARALWSLSTSFLPAGSVGLFEALTRLHQAASLPCLVLCGSRNERTRDQIAAMERGQRCRCLELVAVTRRPGVPSEEALLSSATAILQSGSDLVLTTGCRRRKPGKQGSARACSAPAQALARLAARLIDSCALCGIGVTGGETAQALLQEMGSQVLRPWGEIEPQVPVFALQDGQHRGMLVVTKTGGFGSTEVFCRMQRYLRHMEGVRR